MAKTFEQICKKHKTCKESGEVKDWYPVGNFGASRVVYPSKSGNDLVRMKTLPNNEGSNSIIRGWAIYRYPEHGIEIYVEKRTKKIFYIITN